MLQLFFFPFLNWKLQFFRNQNAICEIIANTFESPSESGPGINGLTQLKSLSHFSIFYDEPFEFSIQNNLEFMPFFSFIYYTLIPKKIPDQNETLCSIQQCFYPISFKWSFKTCWALFWIDKKSYYRVENASYDHMPVWGQCLGNAHFLKPKCPLVENHLWLSACDCNYLTSMGICSMQPAVFVLHPFFVNANLQDLVLCTAQHHSTQFSGPVSSNLR